MKKITDMSAFINPNANDSFSNLKGTNLQDLLCEMDNLYLTYRDTLSLPPYVTFGTEIEYENFSKGLTTLYTKLFLSSWDSRTDGSIFIGGEVVSPCMQDEKKYWEDLKKICHFLKFCNAETKNKAGGHIHIGAHVLGNSMNSWEYFLKLYACYEHVLYRFSLGDKATPRPKQFYYAKPIAKSIIADLEDIKEYGTSAQIRNLLSMLTMNARYSGINFLNIKTSDIVNRRNKNTLEFRFPNATLEEVIWQNNINAFAKMMVSARNGCLDEDFLNYKVNHTKFAPEEEKFRYSEIDLVAALEFVDLVFDTNRDKVYFLRQYLRDYHNNFASKQAIKAKRFVR